MLKIFYPGECVDNIYEINYKGLYKKGIRGIIFDLDNTIIPYEVEKPDKKIIEFLKSLEKMGFTLSIVSNNHKKRVDLFNEDLGLTVIHHGLKPLPKGVNKALRIMKTGKKTAIIGDQIFTDIICANIKGLYSVLVNPIADKKGLVIRFKRRLEKQILKKHLKSL